MLQKDKRERNQLEFVSIEELVPKEHLLRKIDAAVDFKKIYEFTEDLYCPDNGRPSIDPVVLFKMALIQHIFGIPSLRRTAEEVRANIYYRWFLGYLLNEETPHFSTLSYNFKHRYTPETVEKIFYWILDEINNAGYLSPETVFVDGTHIKANANIKKMVKKEIPRAAKIYEEQLLKEINEDREKHGKKPFDGPKPPEKKIVNESATDPDSGVFHKGEHKKCLAYTAQTACDEHGYVVDVTVNQGNVHDSIAFDGLYDRMTEKRPEIKAVVMDAGFKTPWICKKVFDDDRVPVLPYKKEKHAMRYTNLRGLSQVTNWVRLKFAAMNLKKFAIHKWNRDNRHSFQTLFSLLWQIFPAFFLILKIYPLFPFEFRGLFDRLNQGIAK